MKQTEQKEKKITILARILSCANLKLREFKAARISLEKVREIKSLEFKAARKLVPREFKYK